MRDLVFDVKSQMLEKSSACDFSGIVSGTSGYLRAKFNFSSEWNGHNKVAVFTNLLDEKPVLLKNNECVIPPESLTWDYFKVRVVGQKGYQKLTTNTVTVQQEKGGM